MPGFTHIPPGKKVRITLEVRGPRTDEQGQRFKRMLRALLLRNAARLVPARAKAKRKKRKAYR